MRLATLALLVFATSAAAQVGTLDPAFGSGGLVVSDFEDYDDFYGVAPLPDGTLAVVGRSSQTFNLPNTQSARYIRYDDAGTVLVERRYDSSAVGCANVPEAFYDLVVEPEGTILAGGFAQFDCGGPQRDFWVHRLQPDGTSQIFARPSFFGIFENTWALARHPDGRITAGGIASPNTASSTRDLAFTRYTPDGEIDLTFGTMGETTVDAYGDYDFLYDLLAMPDGGVLAAGFAYDGSQYDVLLVRLDGNGNLDAGFGTNGVLTLDYEGGDDYAFKLARQPDGQILAVTRREVAGMARGTILRFLPDGALDPTFGTDGAVLLDYNGLSTFTNGLVVQADGKIVVAGGTETTAGGVHDVLIARFLPDGTLDPSFGTGGMQTASWSEVDDIARSLAIMSDGDLVVLGVTREEVSGETVQDLALARFVGDAPPVANEDAPDSPLALAVAPNPASGAVRVWYALQAPVAVHLSVFDALGREVATLARGPRQAGEHEAVFDAARLPAGVYLVRLDAGGTGQTRAISLAR